METKIRIKVKGVYMQRIFPIFLIPVYLEIACNIIFPAHLLLFSQVMADRA